jgi:hypothetical protein
MTALLYPELNQARLLAEKMIPEGYRRYAKSEGLDPYSYFQTVYQRPTLLHNERIDSTDAGFGPSWKLLWRFFSTLGTSK